jgi:hypothetical protein
MKALPPPDLLLRQWLHNPDALTVAAFALAAAFLGVCAWLVARNLRHNEPGLRAPVAFLFALLVAGFGLFGASRLPANWGLSVGGGVCALAGLLFVLADHRRYVRDPAGRIVADRWRIVLRFAGFSWTGDKANLPAEAAGNRGA